MAAVVSDLMLFSRIDGAAAAAHASLIRVDAPSELAPPTSIDLVLVDWSARRSDWDADLARWCAEATPPVPRVVLFGQHTDLVAHAAARAAGLGPMWARSRLLRELPELVAPAG
ncbi:MAG: hypothetical protein ACRDGK_07250 [Actinomycetota bacterium]